jgi:hypothetical protein
LQRKKRYTKAGKTKLRYLEQKNKIQTKRIATTIATSVAAGVGKLQFRETK